MKVELHREALDELSYAVEWYEQDYPGRGVRFLIAIDRVLARIALAPQAAAERLGARVESVTRFPYIVVFSVADDETIRVLAIAHTRQRPRYWQARR